MGQDISTYLGFAGDASAWYVITRQGSNLYMKKGYHDGLSERFDDVGPGFTVSGDPTRPEIVIYDGAPVVVWLEDALTSLWVARFDGSNWMGLGTAQVASGFIGRIRADTLATRKGLQPDGAAWPDGLPARTTGQVLRKASVRGRAEA